MGYHLLDPDNLEPMPGRSATAHSISEACELETLGLRTYHAAPGEQVPLKYHYHDQQEEAFFVLEGELHVETPDGEFVVDPGQCFVVEPSSPHRAHNPHEATDPVRLIAIGAPSVDDGHEYEPT